MVEVRLSYDELGRRLGIKPEAARQRAKRREREGRWRIVVDNTGRAIVHVEEAELAAEPRSRSADDREHVSPNVAEHSVDDRPNDRGDLVAELRARIKALEVEREALIEAGDHLVDQVGEARERAARLAGELAAVREMSRLEAAALRETMSDLARRLDRATDELRDLRRPWWRRWFGDGTAR
jgi:hypothetical protein